MRSAWRKKFIPGFEEKARVVLNGYEKAGKERNPFEDNGIVIYYRDYCPGITLFIALEISPKRGCFTFEGAWSDDLKFPNLILPLLPDDDPLSSPKGRVLIGDLLPVSDSDHWWWVRSGSKISEALDEGMEAVAEYLLPFLDDVAKGLLAPS